MDNNLLVIDFDYFFPNPCLNTASHPDILLYDWSSNETPNGDNTIPDMIWEIRAAAFTRAGKPLPTVTGYDNFWDRFTLTPDARIYVADSNVHSAHMFPDPHNVWDRIDLYDAHHDAGYANGDNTHVHCGNWLLHHYNLGTTDINVHYPPWRDTIDGTETPPTAPVNRSIDDGHTPDPTTYTMASVCRSGSWVPSWCDPDFNTFTAAAPRPVHYFGPRPTTRDYNPDTVNQLVQAQHDFEAKIAHAEAITEQLQHERAQTMTDVER